MCTALEKKKAAGKKVGQKAGQKETGDNFCFSEGWGRYPGDKQASGLSEEEIENLRKEKSFTPS